MCFGKKYDWYNKKNRWKYLGSMFFGVLLIVFGIGIMLIGLEVISNMSSIQDKTTQSMSALLSFIVILFGSMITLEGTTMFDTMNISKLTDRIDRLENRRAKKC